MSVGSPPQHLQMEMQQQHTTSNASSLYIQNLAASDARSTLDVRWGSRQIGAVQIDKNLPP